MKYKYKFDKCCGRKPRVIVWKCPHCGGNGREANNPEFPDCSSDSETLNHCEAPRKPTYEELEKMLKLEWDEGTGLWAADICEFSTFIKTPWYKPQFLITKKLENSYLIEIFGMFGFFFKSLDDAKQAARKWLIDFVAAALGVDRSGK